MEEPRLYQDSKSGAWKADIRAAGRRRRVTVNVPEGVAPAVYFGVWKQVFLPGLLAEMAGKPLLPEDKSSPRLQDLFDWYINIYLPAGDRSQKTISRYRQILDDFTMFARARHIGRVQQLSPDTIREWQIWMQEHRPAHGGAQRSSATRRDEISVVKRCLTTAVTNGKLRALPFEHWEKPKSRPGTRYKAHSLELIQDVLNLVQVEKPAIYPAISWMAITGWSPEDVIALTWGQIDLARGIKTVSRMKTGKAYPALLTPEERAVLATVAPSKPLPGALVFELPVSGHKARMQYLHKHLSRLTLKHLELKIIPRDLRKTFGSLHASGALGQPTNPKELMMLMAHSNLETTMMFYTDVSEEQLFARASAGAAAMLGQKTTEQNGHQSGT